MVTILNKFGGIQSITDYLSDIDDKILGKIITIVNEAEDFEVKDAEALIYDSEIEINDQLEKGSVDEEKARRIIEDQLINLASILKMDWEEDTDLRRAALEKVSLPFEFDKIIIRKLVDKLKQRQSKEFDNKIKEIEITLKKYKVIVKQTVEKAVILDQMIAIASTMNKYGMTIPMIAEEGVNFTSGRNIFLLEDIPDKVDRKVQPVNYHIGKSQITNKKDSGNVVLLTGANSGGKTTILTTLATIHILTILGLPVPCDKAEIAPMPLYLFRRRMTKKIGSLEQALRSLIPVFADPKKKLILIDEFEALTESGAAGGILASLINRSAVSSRLVLLITHLARETLPYVKLPIRVDGIEATGLDESGQLIVDRQPKFNHVGSSTPKFIIEKLSRRAKQKKVKVLYGEILSSLESDTINSFQTRINLPWSTSEKND
jgi:dsDNA-specific endonuclease/ATPase MutS2